MSCCGQKRHALRETSRIPQRTEPPAYAPPFQNPTLMQHTGAASLIVRGAVTRHAYLFGPRGAALAVDERDAPGLIATGLFEAQGT
jgi:hypothetical protein